MWYELGERSDDCPVGYELHLGVQTRDVRWTNHIDRTTLGPEVPGVFRVLDDVWSDDYMNRTLRSIELLEISACSTPASPRTSISLDETAAKKKKLFSPEGGPDGTQNAPYPYGGLMGGDGSGSRDKARWSNAEKRARTGGVEQRANLAGSFEVRAFTVWVPSPAVRAVDKLVTRNGALKLERDLLQLRRRRKPTRR